MGDDGREEITGAACSFLPERADQEISLKNVAQAFYTESEPDPEVIIRTSGESRLSGFMLWQSGHSELYFYDSLWPVFTR